MADRLYHATNFSGCDCRGMDFSNAAHMQGTPFIGANLEGANFSNADITGMNFTRANLDGATFEDALVTGGDMTAEELIKCAHRKHQNNVTMPDGSILNPSQPAEAPAAPPAKGKGNGGQQ